MRRLGTLFCVLAVFQVLGGPLAALQTVAWVRMLITYSHSGGVAAGIAQTFDGQHMCSLCKEVAQKTGGQQKDLGDVLVNKIFLECLAASPRLFPPEFYWLRESDNSVAHNFVQEPRLQPPRTA